MSLPTDFHPFSPLHALTAAACLALMAGSIMLGRLWIAHPRTAPRERWLRVGWCLFTLLWQAYAVVWLLLPTQWNPAVSLPLHVCDLTGWIAPLALLTQKRWLRTILYYWGIGLSTQAFITPVLLDGPATWWYWFFWVGHLQIVGSAVYDLVVLRYRPTWRDLRVIALVSLAYALAMLALNTATGFNYGYLGPSKPTNPTLIDRLGVWPLRALWLTLIGQAIFVLITLSWPHNWRWARADRLAP